MFKFNSLTCTQRQTDHNHSASDKSIKGNNPMPQLGRETDTGDGEANKMKRRAHKHIPVYQHANNYSVHGAQTGSLT